MEHIEHQLYFEYTKNTEENIKLSILKLLENNYIWDIQLLKEGIFFTYYNRNRLIFM